VLFLNVNNETVIDANRRISRSEAASTHEPSSNPAPLESHDGFALLLNGQV